MKVIFFATLFLVVFQENIHSTTATTSKIKSIGQEFITFLLKLQQSVQELKKLHKPCEPCNASTKENKVCDCTNIEPRRDCLEFNNHGFKLDGIYRIKGLGLQTLQVYCDQTTQGGGWTVFQRRQDGSVDFSRKWNDYKMGFGNLEGEFWFGNQYIHELTKPSFAPKKSKLLINMRMKGKQIPEYVKYNTFEITDEATKYTLKISGLSGNVTTDKTKGLDYNNNKKFTTIDSDHDGHVDNCATIRGGGGWWYDICSYVWLNSQYNFTKSSGEIGWNHQVAQPEFVEMKMRRNL